MFSSENLMNHISAINLSQQELEVTRPSIETFSNMLALIDETEAMIEQAYDVGINSEEDKFKEISSLLEKKRDFLKKTLQKRKTDTNNKNIEKQWRNYSRAFFLSSDEEATTSNGPLRPRLASLHHNFQNSFRELPDAAKYKSLCRKLKEESEKSKRESLVSKYYECHSKKDKEYLNILNILKRRGPNYFEKKSKKMAINSSYEISTIIDKAINFIAPKFNAMVSDDPSEFFFDIEKYQQCNDSINLDHYFSNIVGLIQEEFKITLRKSADTSWHEQCEVYNLHDDENNLIGIWHIDFYKRDAKYDGAWAQTAFSRRKLPNGTIQVPVVYLGFSYTDKNISYKDTRPLLHELGHALEHCLDQQSIYALTGYYAQTDDLKEVSSLYFETFMNHPKLINLFKDSAEDLINSYRREKIRDFSYICLLSKLDIEIHRSEFSSVDKLKKSVNEIIRNTGINYPFLDENFLLSFDHAFWSEDYASIYYSYLLGFIYAHVLKSSTTSEKWNHNFWKNTSNLNKVELLEKLMGHKMSELDLKTVLDL